MEDYVALINFTWCVFNHPEWAEEWLRRKYAE